MLSISRVSPICYLAALDCIISNLVLGGRTCGIAVSDDSELVIIGFGISYERKCVVTVLNHVDVLVSTKSACAFHIFGSCNYVRGSSTCALGAVRKRTIFKENCKLEFIINVKVECKLVNIACTSLLGKVITVKIGSPTVYRTRKYPVAIILEVCHLPLSVCLSILSHSSSKIESLRRSGSYKPTSEDIAFLGRICRLFRSLTLFNLNCVKDGSAVIVIESECEFFCLCLKEEARCQTRAEQHKNNHKGENRSNSAFHKIPPK